MTLSKWEKKNLNSTYKFHVAMKVMGANIVSIQYSAGILKQ